MLIKSIPDEWISSEHKKCSTIDKIGDLCYLFAAMKMLKALLQVGAFVVLALAVAPATANAQPAGPSQQVVSVTGNGDLTGTALVPAGTTRLWVVRLDGDGALSPRAVEGLRLTAAEEDQLTFESAASNSAALAEPAELAVGVHHDTWGTTRLLVRTEVGGAVSDEDAGKNPWLSARTGLVWPISSKGNGALGGLGLAAVKPLGGPWVGLVELDTNFEGATRGFSSQSGSDWASYRFGFGFGQSRPYGTRWALGAGVDFGQYGVGAERPLYAKIEASRTSLPGQPWEGRVRALGTVGPSGASLGGSAGWDFRLLGPATVGLSADANAAPGSELHAAVGPSVGVNVPIKGSTLRIRSGARLGIAKDASGQTGVITPFIELGLEKGN